jgi:hypothetical protein
MSKSDVEPFPPLQGLVHSSRSDKHKTHGKVRRRKSSALGGELPGDSGVPSLASLTTPPPTPTEYAVCVPLIYAPSTPEAEAHTDLRSARRPGAARNAGPSDA